MSCFCPNSALEIVDQKTGEISIVFKNTTKDSHGLFFKVIRELKLPCGQCVGCRSRRTLEWGARCMHEAKMHDDNCFVTLTYDDNHLPKNGSLVLKDIQDFFKRLRDRYSDIKIRVFYCGEYGELLSRPHYHALIFGFDFPDKVFWKNENENPYYLSSTLESLWPFGFSSIGLVSFQSACYVAGYIQKKITGSLASKFYGGRVPEFAHMSTGRGIDQPHGIGHGFYNKYKHDVYPSDQVISHGKPFTPPRYYDKLLALEKPRLLEKLKVRRVVRAEKFAADQTPARLKARHICAKAKLRQKKRGYENG